MKLNELKPGSGYVRHFQYPEGLAYGYVANGVDEIGVMIVREAQPRFGGADYRVAERAVDGSETVKECPLDVVSEKFEEAVEYHKIGRNSARNTFEREEAAYAAAINAKNKLDDVILAQVDVVEAPAEGGDRG